MRTSLFLIMALMITGMVACQNPSSRQETQKPNIIFIFADDWGFGKVSNFHQGEDVPHDYLLYNPNPALGPAQYRTVLTEILPRGLTIRPS
jgi:hypothetical protein